jgi:hypothetical protein
MLKPKKGFVQAQLNIERLTPIQWDGIMRAMDAYAEHYHDEQVKKLNIPAVIKSVCDDCTAYPFDERGKTPLCSTCKDNPKQTVL